MAVTNAAAPNTTSSSSVREVHRTTGGDPAIAYTLYEPDAPISDLTMLLLHGAAHDERCWQYHWTAYLSQHGWRCLTLSYRSYGESAWSRPVQEASLDDDVADVNTFLAAEGLKSRHMITVGHSLGGAIAQRLAAQQDVAGLIIIASLALGWWMREALPKMPGQFIRQFCLTQCLTPGASGEAPSLFPQRSKHDYRKPYQASVRCPYQHGAARGLVARWDSRGIRG